MASISPSFSPAAFCTGRSIRSVALIEERKFVALPLSAAILVRCMVACGDA
jgi:hypothetical protein